MTNVLTWPLHLRENRHRDAGLPDCFYSAAPAFEHESMPPEVAMLLPASDGASAFFRTLAATRGDVNPSAAAFFMADPFVSAREDGRRLAEMGIRWVANIPSVDQHDEEFTQFLDDVGLNLDMERRVLGAFKAAGLKIAAAVSSVDSAAQVAAFDADAVFVLPRVSDFAAGFPSPRQRSATAQSIRSALHAAAWSGPLLGYGDEREAAQPSQWPEAVDGIVGRPVAAALAKERS